MLKATTLLLTATLSACQFVHLVPTSNEDGVPNVILALPAEQTIIAVDPIPCHDADDPDPRDYYLDILSDKLNDLRLLDEDGNRLRDVHYYMWDLREDCPLNIATTRMAFWYPIQRGLDYTYISTHYEHTDQTWIRVFSHETLHQLNFLHCRDPDIPSGVWCLQSLNYPLDGCEFPSVDLCLKP